MEKVISLYSWALWVLANIPKTAMINAFIRAYSVGKWCINEHLVLY